MVSMTVDWMQNRRGSLLLRALRLLPGVRHPTRFLYDGEVAAAARLLQLSEEAVQLARRDHELSVRIARQFLPPVRRRRMVAQVRRLFGVRAVIYQTQPEIVRAFHCLQESLAVGNDATLLDCYLEFCGSMDAHVQVAARELGRRLAQPGSLRGALN